MRTEFFGMLAFRENYELTASGALAPVLFKGFIMVFVYFAAIRVSEVFYGFCLFYRNYGLCSLYSFFLECNFRVL